MKITLVISFIIAFSTIHPLFAFVGPTTTLITAPIPITSQFHSQDSFGQYAYGYNGGPSIKTETKTVDGITRGSYSYIDPDGKLQTVEYTADALNGFRAAATNLPQPPVDDRIAPEPVQETPEVAKARAEHLAAYKEAEIRAAKYPEESTTPQENASSIERIGSGDGRGLQQEIAATVESLPTATTISLQSPLTTGLKTIELPASSYSYRIDSPVQGYSVITPTVYNTPLTTYTLSTAPVVAGVRPLTIATRILADRTIELARKQNGNNS